MQEDSSCIESPRLLRKTYPIYSTSRHQPSWRFLATEAVHFLETGEDQDSWIEDSQSRVGDCGVFCAAWSVWPNLEGRVVKEGISGQISTGQLCVKYQHHFCSFLHDNSNVLLRVYHTLNVELFTELHQSKNHPVDFDT